MHIAVLAFWSHQNKEVPQSFLFVCLHKLFCYPRQQQSCGRFKSVEMEKSMYSILCVLVIHVLALRETTLYCCRGSNKVLIQLAVISVLHWSAGAFKLSFLSLVHQLILLCDLWTKKKIYIDHAIHFKTWLENVKKIVLAKSYCLS